MPWHPYNDEHVPTPNLEMPPRPEDLPRILRRQPVLKRYREPDEEDITNFRYAGSDRLALYWMESYNYNHSYGFLKNAAGRHKRRAEREWNAWYREYVHLYKGYVDFDWVVHNARSTMSMTQRQPFRPKRYIILRTVGPQDQYNMSYNPGWLR